MRILLRGYYGGRNVGDDALLWVMLRELDRLFPGAAVCVTPGINSAIPGTSLQLTNRPPGRLRYAATVARSDLLLYGGGGVLQEHSDDGGILASHLRLSTLARLTQTPSIYLGVSVGPLEGERAAARTRRLMGAATLVTLRDHASRRLLEAIGASGNIQVTHDLALLLAEEPAPPRDRPARPTLGVSTNAFHSAAYQNPEADVEVHDAIAEALDIVMAAHPDLVVKFICFHSGEAEDLWVACHVRERLREPERTAVFPYASDPRETLAEVAACNWMLSFRLHAAIFAYMTGVPLFALDYHPKVAGFAEMIGLPEAATMPTEALEARPLADALIALLDGAMPGPAVPLVDSLAAARRNFELLAEIARQ